MKIKRLLSIIISFTMLFSVFGTTAFANETKQIERVFSIEPQQYYSSNAIDQESLTDYLEEKLMNLDTDIDISQFNIPYTNTGLDLISNIMNGFTNPEIFHIDLLNTSFYHNSNKISKINTTYLYSRNVYNEMLTNFRNTADALLDGIDDSFTDTEKALILHDRLVLHNEYDNENANSSNPDPITFTAYAALINRTSVCQGYAKAYMYLLDRVGIKNEFCSSEQLNHIWNIVYINNKPYHVDVTWDDSTHCLGDVLHTNFLLSTNALIANGHKIAGLPIDYDSSPVDTCFDQYFWQQSLSAFIPLNGKLYYIDNTEEAIYSWNNNVSSLFYGIEPYWNGLNVNYARLDTDENDLLFSGINNVYRLNPSNKQATKIFTSNLDVDTCIYSFDYENRNLTYYTLDKATDGSGFYPSQAKNVSLCDHKFTDNKSDGTHHWKVCAVCGAADPSSIEAHYGGVATCTSQAQCSVCGESYGGFAAHTPVASGNYGATCTHGGWEGQTVCAFCNTVISAGYATPTLAHTAATSTTKATLTENGNTVMSCTVCGTVTSIKTIYRIKTVSLSSASYTYDGKTKKPTVKVKDSAGKTISSSNYTVTYASGRKNIGKYKVTVKFKGNYSGTKTLYFNINPVKTTVKSVTAGKKSLKVSVTAKKSSQVSGYQVQYSTSKKFTSSKTKTLSGYKKTSVTISGLKSNKTYYVRVRTYKTVKGVKYYSGWSTYKYKKAK